MKEVATYTISLIFAGAVVIALAQTPSQTSTSQSTPPPSPNPDSQYRLGPDSMPQEGVPKGEIRGPYTLPSNAYPGTQHTIGCTCRRNTIQRLRLP